MIPIQDAIKSLEDAHLLSINSKGHPRSMALVRYLDAKILELKAIQREQQRPTIWKSLLSWAHVGNDPDAPEFLRR